MVKVGDAEFSKELSIVTVCRKCTFTPEIFFPSQCLLTLEKNLRRMQRHTPELVL